MEQDRWAAVRPLWPPIKHQSRMMHFRRQRHHARSTVPGCLPQAVGLSPPPHTHSCRKVHFFLPHAMRSGYLMAPGLPCCCRCGLLQAAWVM